MRTRILATHCLPAITALACAAEARARDVFLTIGGGYSPKGNQVSLEKNVLFYQRLLAEERPDGASHDIYFADGNAPERDLQFSNMDALPTANWLMADLFGKEDSIDLEYRNHEIPGVRGETSKENLAGWFGEVGSTLEPGDRLIIYVTAHGSRSRDKDRPYNTRLYLWDDETIPAAEVAELLDRLPQSVQVIVVMVQCYSGGFASLIFNEANDEKGLADRELCGFFATVHDRVAAGCTADIEEEDYHEYSTYFWAAIGGRTRMDQALERPDYNGDRDVSFDEAHAYVMLASDTIDIPTKTSDRFLRAYSKLRSEEHPELLSADSRYAYLRELATPAERAVLEGLSAELELVSDRRADAADDLADQIEERRQELAEAKSDKEKRHKGLKRQIAEDLKSCWPELHNVLSATATALLTTRAGEFEEAVISHPSYSEFTQLAEEISALEEERFELERRWAKCRRLERVLQNVALARNLSQVASPEIVRRYEHLIAAEQSTLHSAQTIAPPSPDAAE
jgi:hypothetical protein